MIATNEHISSRRRYKTLLAIIKSPVVIYTSCSNYNFYIGAAPHKTEFNDVEL